MCPISVIAERILLVEQLLVQISSITGRISADIGIPCAHGPSRCVIGVERNRIRIFLDLLQRIDEFIRCLRKLSDPRFFKYFLVVDDSLCSRCRRDAIDFIFVSPLGCIVDKPAHCVQITKAHEVNGQVCLVNSRDHHHCLIVTGLKMCQSIIRIISVRRNINFDTRIHLMKRIQVLLPCNATVIFGVKIRAVVKHSDGGFEIGIVFSQCDICITICKNRGHHGKSRCCHNADC